MRTSWELLTPRLRMRPMTPADRPALARVLQDPAVMYAYEHAFSDEEVADWLQRQLDRYAECGFGLWLVECRTDGRVIGQCGVTRQPVPPDIAPGPVPEVGYLFEKAIWHKGYAAEAARACRDYAFRALGVPAVYSIIRDTNTASRAVALRNGMQVVGQFTKHYHGVEMPHLVYPVRAEEEGLCPSREV